MVGITFRLCKRQVSAYRVQDIQGVGPFIQVGKLFSVVICVCLSVIWVVLPDFKPKMWLEGLRVAIIIAFS